MFVKTTIPSDYDIYIIYYIYTGWNQWIGTINYSLHGHIVITELFSDIYFLI